MLRLFVVVLAGLVLASPVRADAAMQEAATAFYAVYGALPRQGGLPNATARTRYAPVLSPRLNQLLVDAAAAQTRFDRMVRGAAPPLIEGEIFSSLFEGPTSWTVGTCAGDGAAAHCSVAMVHLAQGHPPVRWTDTLVLVRAQNAWKVDDIVYDPSLGGANTGRLSSLLGMVLAQAPP